MLGTGPELAYLSYMANRLKECHRALTEDGSLYLHCDPTMSHMLKLVLDAIFGKHNFRNEIIWHYGKWSNAARHYQKNHDVILFYSKTPGYFFQRQFLTSTDKLVKLQKGYQVNRPDGIKQLIVYDRKKAARVIADGDYDKIVYRDKSNPGSPLHDTWDDINIINSQAKERIGYPTQKPIALLERILRGSNDEGIVLDPFCGCGTTIHAAQNLGMPWIGIDVCAQACKVIQHRIESHFDSLWGNIEFVGMPKTIDDAKTLAEYDKPKFEKWAASLTPGMEANKKQVADGGIDGRGRYPLRKGVFADVVSQVKGGGTGPGDVQAFNGARLQANADMGVFTCFDDRVTNGMRDAAVNAGRFQKWPVLQIYTVEDYFAERKPDLPLAA